jgi:hypothetical protein
MQNKKWNWRKDLKFSLKLSFGIAYWLVIGFMIFLGWIGAGTAFAVVAFLLALFGYWLIAKMTKFIIKLDRKNQAKEQSQ